MSRSTHSPNETIILYTIGYVLSLILSISAYLIVRHYLSTAGGQSTNAVIAAIMAFAGVQLIVQLIFFLHLGDEKKPRWNLIVFTFMASVVVILVGGSIWIMKNLEYGHDHRTPQEINNYIIEDEGIKQ